MKIHPSATIASGVIMGKDVVIGPYVCIQSPNVILKDRVRIESHVYIEGNVSIGESSIVRSFATIGTQGQIYKNKGKQNPIYIGKECDIGEYVTIHSPYAEKGCVRVGDHCHLMPHVHVAHDCVLGHYVVLGQGAQLAGYVMIGNKVTIADRVCIHQFCRVGSLAIIKGMTRVVTFDVPPYTCGGGFPYFVEGSNVKHLQNQGLSQALCQELQKAISALYNSKLTVQEALLWIEKNLHPFPEILELVEFCRSSKRGLMGLRSEILYHRV